MFKAESLTAIMAMRGCYISAVMVAIVGATSLMKMTEGAASVSLMVLPSESRRQGLAQEDPCPGDTVVFTCTLNGSMVTGMRWLGNERTLYSFFIPSDVGQNMTNLPGLVTVLLNETTSTLSVSLNDSVMVTSGTRVACRGNTETLISPSISFTTIGPASAPAVTLRAVDNSTLIVDARAADTGRFCVDTYRATVVVNENTLLPVEQSVADPMQLNYTFTFSSLDLCTDIVNRITVVPVTNSMEGQSGSPSSTSNFIDRSRIVLMSLSATQFFTSSGIRFTLDWQVMDNNIMLDKLTVSCQSIICQVEIISTSQSNILLSYDDSLVGRGITFSVTYSPELCEDTSVETSQIIVNANSSSPQEVRDQRAVMVEFSDSLFDVNIVRVMFSSNCTATVIIGYSNPLSITIPDTAVSTGQCRYNITLIDSNSQVIGYPITGVFEADGLPNIARGGDYTVIIVICVIVGVIVLTGFVLGGGSGYTYYRYKRKQGILSSEGKETHELKDDTDGGSGEPNIDHEKGPGGDEYAVVTSTNKTKEEVTLESSISRGVYQDPSSIQREQAPGGELYAKPKKGNADDVAAMYSTPDKSKKTQNTGLVYAAIDTNEAGGGGAGDAGSGGSGRLVQLPPPTEYSTVVY